jgi:hypothetical protein
MWPSQNSKTRFSPPVFHIRYPTDNSKETVLPGRGMDSAMREGESLSPRSGPPAGHAQSPPGDGLADFLIFDHLIFSILSLDEVSLAN